MDEAGRGPLAGPVVAACVILPKDCDTSLFKDSKKLTKKQRDTAFQRLHENDAIFGIAQASHEEIDQINILRASLLAMQRAVEQCALACDTKTPPGYLLVDGNFPVPINLPQSSLVKGESRSASIAAASILAKVTRDQIMEAAHYLYPKYGFAEHKGYPTKKHREAIREHGPCPLHRKTFRGVAEFLGSLF